MLQEDRVWSVGVDRFLLFLHIAVAKKKRDKKTKLKGVVKGERELNRERDVE